MEAPRLMSSLIGYGFFVLCGAFQQKLIRIENTILAQTTGHDSLGFILQQVWHRPIMLDFQYRSWVLNSLVQHKSQTALFFYLIIITRNMGYREFKRQGLGVIINGLANHCTRNAQVTFIDFFPLLGNLFDGQEILCAGRG